MMLWMFLLIGQIIKKKYLLILFLIIGILFRSYAWQAFSLSFDQVQILTNAEKIISGKLTLIGPRTGPANTFTGPLIYYLAALLIALFGSIKTAVLLSIILSTVTGLILYYLSIQYLDKKTALFSFIIWSISPLLINLDRILWNPNLSLMAFAFVFYPLIFAKKINKVDLLLIALGSFLSYQAHFSAFLLPVIVFLITIIDHRPKKLFFASLIGLIISLLPTFIFDLRHNFLNSQGIWALLSNETSSLDLKSFFQNFYQNILINFEVFSQLLYRGKNTLIRISIGILLSIISLILQRDKKNLMKILKWPLLTIFLMSFYQSEIPQYYFLINVPVFLYLLSNSFKRINYYFLIIFCLFLIFTSTQYLNKIISAQNDEFSLGNSLAIKNKILEIDQENDIREINYLLPHASDFGIKYLIEPLNLIKDTGVKVNIIYAADQDLEVVARYGRIAIEIQE